MCFRIFDCVWRCDAPPSYMLLRYPISERHGTIVIRWLRGFNDRRGNLGNANRTSVYFLGSDSK